MVSRRPGSQMVAEVRVQGLGSQGYVRSTGFNNGFALVDALWQAH